MKNQEFLPINMFTDHLNKTQILGAYSQVEPEDKNWQCLFEAIQETTPGASWWKNKHGVYGGSNKNIVNIIGLKPEEFIGKTDHELPWPWCKSADELVAHDKEVMNSGVAQEFEEIVCGSDGKEHAFLVIKSPLRNRAGEIIGTVGSSFDISDRKKMEEALKQAKNQEEELRNAVTIFAGSIAHDLRTPLTTQSMMVRHYQTKIEKIITACKEPNAQPAAIADQLEKLIELPEELNAVNRDMNAYITDTLKALEKTISGVKTADDLVLCSLWKCLQKAINTYPCSEEERGLIHWDRSVTFDFMGNPILFYRVISNLLKNAFEQIHERGQGEIYISAQKTEEFNQLLIKDTAGGVTEELIEQLFKGYKTTKKEGTGIGLVFCKNVMESFGGKITCYLVDDDKIEFRLSFLGRIR